VLALVSWALGCADPVEQAVTPAPVTIELVTVEQGLYDGKATYWVRNVGDRALAYQGSSGTGEPNWRIAIQFEGKWLERKPAWVDCATGREFYTLDPGAEAKFEVLAQRPDLPMRVGVGTWEPRDGDPPRWMEWTWAWSRSVIVDDELNRSGG
jgi:hypothetical protein